MAKYRKKPVIVEAEVYKPGMEDGHFFRCNWYESEHGKNPCDGCAAKHDDYCNTEWLERVNYISTLEGRHEITPGDYIITGVKGERYPCKPDIFEMAYDAVCPGEPNEGEEENDS